MFFNVFWNAAHATSNQKMLPKSTQRLQKSSPRRPRCSQDGLLEPTWAPKCLPRRSKNSQKGPVFLLFFRFLVPHAPKSPPGRPRQRNLEQREPPRVPQTPSGPWFQYNFGRFLMKCWRTFCHDLLSLFSFPLLCFALLNWINKQSINTSTHQAHCWSNTALPARWRVMRST